MRKIERKGEQREREQESKWIKREDRKSNGERRRESESESRKSNGERERAGNV